MKRHGTEEDIQMPNEHRKTALRHCHWGSATGPSPSKSGLAQAAPATRFWISAAPLGG